MRQCRRLSSRLARSTVSERDARDNFLWQKSCWKLKATLILLSERLDCKPSAACATVFKAIPRCAANWQMNEKQMFLSFPFSFIFCYVKIWIKFSCHLSPKNVFKWIIFINVFSSSSKILFNNIQRHFIFLLTSSSLQNKMRWNLNTKRCVINAWKWTQSFCSCCKLFAQQIIET